MGAPGAAAGAAVAAMIRAIKASGVVVRVKPPEFSSILDRAKGSLVVQASGGFFTTSYKYLVAYKGFAFYTKSKEPIPLPGHVETIHAKRIWAPD